MVNIKINNKELSVSKDLTILQAASLVDIQIPRFCYHEKLTIAGNCRMCLVEVAKVNKPVASCALPVSEGMQVYTNSILVKKAREGVLELLLANHPLDCPICDQGGECDLQEQSMIFGNDRSRFYETKRAVSDKNISPFIKTIMTRCIHCTRCVRFLNEIGGVNELGITGRGSSSEIGTYIHNSISSELSGNIIDLCPVGALTSKPYAFTTRPWELRSTETIDLMDCLGSNIKVDTRGPNIMRILPKINEDLNEEWITDKTRFSFDGYKSQRLSNPLFSQKIVYKYIYNNFNIVEKTKLFIICTWEQAFLIFSEFFNLYKKEKKNTNIIVGNQLNIESNVLVKQIKKVLDFNFVQNQYFYFNFNTKLNKKNIDFQSSYLLNISPIDFEKVDNCLLVGANLRLENPLLNSRLRKAFLLNNAQIAIIGPTTNSLYNAKKLGNSLSTLIKILEGKHSFNNALFNSNKKSIILFGSSFVNNISSFLLYLKKIEFKYKHLKIGYLNSNIGENIINEYNIESDYINLNIKNNSLGSFNYVLKADDFTFSAYLLKNKNFNTNNFIVYQGFQADRSAQISDLVFPESSFLEEKSSYFDINNVVNNTNICVPSPIGSRTSWKILNALLSYFNFNFNKNNNLDLEIKNRKNYNNFKSNINIVGFKFFYFYNNIYNNLIGNYYKTNSVTRNSQIMSQMTKQKTINNIRF